MLGRVQRDQHRLHSLLAASSLTDRLTGLYNYGTFVDYLHNELTKADRYGGELTLIMFDLDHFKRFNDRYGHEAGNELLRRVAPPSRPSREADMAARYGGEEFALLINGDAPTASSSPNACGTPSTHGHRAARRRSGLDHGQRRPGHLPPGVTRRDAAGRTGRRALYESKRAGATA